MAHKNKMYKYPNIQQARVNYAYCVGSNPGWKKMRFQLALNKTFCPNPQPLTHRQVKQRQRKKINKTVLSAPSLPPQWYFTLSELKCKYVFNSQLGSQNFMLPLILNTNLIKQISLIKI